MNVFSNTTHAAGQITLADGKPARLPADLSSAIRVRALAPSDSVDPAAKGDIMVTLDFAVEPRMRWQKALTIRITKAIDDQGQVLEQNLEAKADPGAPGIAPKIGIAVPPLPVAQPAKILQRAQPAADHNNKIWLKKGEKASASIKEIRGTVTAEVLDKLRPAITAAEILQSAGKTFKGTAGGALKVIEVKTTENGLIKIQFELETPPGASGPAVMGVGGNVKVNAAGGGPAVFAQFPSGSQDEQLVLLDDKGKAVPIIATAFSFGAGGTRYTLTFMPAKDQGVPARLVYSTRNTVTVDIPFILTDVPLSMK